MRYPRIWDDCARRLVDQPNIDSSMPAARTIAIPGRRKKAVMTSSRGIGVVVTISIRVSPWLLAICVSVLVSIRHPMFILMLIGTRLSLLLSMFVLAVLGIEAEG
jgi:hypothetical protein